MIRKSLMLLILVGLLATLSLFAAAYLTAQVSVANNQFTNGTVALTTSPTSALITYSNLAPGDQVIAPLQVSNTGSLDVRYAMTTSVPVVIQSLLVGGAMWSVNNQARDHLALLDVTGQLGAAPFAHGTFAVNTMIMQPDGKVIVLGNPSVFNDGFPGRVGVLRLNSDGSRDTSFRGVDWNGQPRDGLVLANGQILIVGDFTQVDGQAHPHLVRLNRDGSVDDTFGGINLTNPPWDAASGQIYDLVRQENDQLILGGQFVTVNGQAHKNLVRLNSDGTVDGTFNASLDDGTPGSLRALALQPDGKLLVGGYFNTVNHGTPRTKLARFNSDGSLDATFQVVLDDNLESIQLQSDGQIVIAGYFSTVNGQPRPTLARLSPTGALDPSFNVAVTGWVDGAVALQPDGKILIAGDFSAINGQTRTRLARLLPDGALDPTFVASTDGTVRAFGWIPDLSGVVQLAIKTGVTTCTADGFALDGTWLYRGPLAGAWVGNPAPGHQAGDRALAALANETLCFQASLPLATGNVYQSTATTATFTFIAEQTANNP